MLRWSLGHLEGVDVESDSVSQLWDVARPGIVSNDLGSRRGIHEDGHVIRFHPRRFNSVVQAVLEYRAQHGQLVLGEGLAGDRDCDEERAQGQNGVREAHDDLGVFVGRVDPEV